MLLINQLAERYFEVQPVPHTTTTAKWVDLIGRGIHYGMAKVNCTVNEVSWDPDENDKEVRWGNPYIVSGPAGF